MSSVSSSLSAGAQLLTNEKLLLPGASQSDVGGATPDQGVRKAAPISPQTHAALFGSSSSPDGDTVEFSAEAMQMLQQMGGVGTTAAPVAHAYSAPAASESIDYFG